VRHQKSSTRKWRKGRDLPIFSMRTAPQNVKARFYWRITKSRRGKPSASRPAAGLPLRALPLRDSSRAAYSSMISFSFAAAMSLTLPS
jgi:hypothetical protein